MNAQARARRLPPEPETPLPRGSVVKMSVLARMSGVPAATIKHYVREGLLPEPARTSRNMAYYDAELVPRIRKIKELQRTRFLPLKVIRQVLDEEALPSTDDTVGAAIGRVLQGAGPGERRTRAELEASGVRAEQLDWLKSVGAITPEKREDGVETYAGDDLEILRVLGTARKAGLAAEMLPLTILGEYTQALSALVRAELRIFREGVVPHAGEDLASLTEAATTLSERLVVLLRRKMLLPTLRALVAQEAPAPTKTPSRAPEARRAPRKPARTRSRKAG